MASTVTIPKLQNPKTTLSQLQPNPSDTNPSAGSQDVHPLTTTTNSRSPPPSSGGGGGETKAAEAISENADTAAAVTDIQKKTRRAERFGVPVQLSEEEKRNSRAERFGTGTGSHGSEASKKSEENKRKARAERFGLAQSTSADEEAKKKARFAPASKPDPVEEDKRKARAVRFSQNQSPSLTQTNGDGTIETTAPVLGKAGGGP